MLLSVKWWNGLLGVPIGSCCWMDSGLIDGGYQLMVGIRLSVDGGYLVDGGDGGYLVDGGYW